MKKTIMLSTFSSLLLTIPNAYAGGSSILSDHSGGGATSSSFYAGASVGRSYHDNCDELSGNEYGENFTCSRDNSDPAWKVFGGYKVLPNLAIEAAYIDFGEYSTTRHYEDNDKDPAFDAKGVSLMAVGSVPLTKKVNLFGKLGMLTWEQDVSDPAFPEGGTSHNEGTDLAVGVGIGVQLSKNISLRAEAEHFDDIDVNLVSVGVVFNTH